MQISGPNIIIWLLRKVNNILSWWRLSVNVGKTKRARHEKGEPKCTKYVCVNVTSPAADVRTWSSEICGDQLTFRPSSAADIFPFYAYQPLDFNDVGTSMASYFAEYSLEGYRSIEFHAGCKILRSRKVQK